MKLIILSLILILSACSSSMQEEKSSAPDSAPMPIVTEADYLPIEGGLDVVTQNPESSQQPDKDQLQMIVEKHIFDFPVYNYETPAEYDKVLVESYRRAKDELDQYYSINLEAIESQFINLPYEELIRLEAYISDRYIVVNKRFATDFIKIFFHYKSLYAQDLLNIKVFDPKLLSTCGIVGDTPYDGVKDASELVDKEIDLLDDIDKNHLIDYWGGDRFVDTSGMKSITLFQAINEAKKLEKLREVLYDNIHCKDPILAAQKLYQYLLSSDLRVFKSKYLTRDPQKAEQQANLISDYVKSILKLASDKNYNFEYHGKLAKYHSKSFEAKMLLHGPWANKKSVLQSLKPGIFITMAEKFLEGSRHSDKEFYKVIRCNMHKNNHLAVNDNPLLGPISLIPLSITSCH